MKECGAISAVSKQHRQHWENEKRAVWPPEQDAAVEIRASSERGRRGGEGEKMEDSWSAETSQTNRFSVIMKGCCHALKPN